VSELFRFCRNLHGFNNIFVRALSGETTNAVEFYKKIGFNPVGKEIPCESTDRPRDLVSLIQDEKFVPDEDFVIPMSISLKDTSAYVAKTDQKFKRENLTAESVDLMKELDI
jgi:hypothetical protein